MTVPMTAVQIKHVSAEDKREKLLDAMIAAFKATGASRYQGFYYMPYHVIRDLSRSGRDQRVWEAYGAGENYDAAHDAMMARLERLRFEAVLDVALAHIDIQTGEA